MRFSQSWPSIYWSDCATQKKHCTAIPFHIHSMCFPLLHWTNNSSCQIWTQHVQLPCQSQNQRQEHELMCPDILQVVLQVPASCAAYRNSEGTKPLKAVGESTCTASPDGSRALQTFPGCLSSSVQAGQGKSLTGQACKQNQLELSPVNGFVTKWSAVMGIAKPPDVV